MKDRLYIEIILLLTKASNWLMKWPNLYITDPLWRSCTISAVSFLSLRANHRNGNVIILTKFSSLAALKVVKMTTSSAASDENFVKMTTFSFQWWYRLDFHEISSSWLSNASLPVSYPGANFLKGAARITAIHLTIIVMGNARLPFLTSNHWCSAWLHPIEGVILGLHCMEIITAQPDRWVHKLNAKDLVWISHMLNLRWASYFSQLPSISSLQYIRGLHVFNSSIQVKVIERIFYSRILLSSSNQKY